MQSKPQQKIAIASDHAGLDLKIRLQALLPHYQWVDLGPTDKTSVDYPDFAQALCKKIQSGECDFGILLCGSGIGMSIAANKVQGIRAALLENTVAARLAREHNNAQVACLGARFLAPEYASEICTVFLSTPFNSQASPNSRHEARIKKIAALEKT